MSAVISHNGNSYLVTKGSPESLKELLSDVPERYDNIVEKYNLIGYRILCLAYKELPDHYRHMSEEELAKL